MTRDWKAWLVWLGVLAAVTAMLVAIRDRVGIVHVTLVYLVVVQLASARGGRPLGGGNIDSGASGRRLHDFADVRLYGVPDDAPNLRFIIDDENSVVLHELNTIWMTDNG